MAEIHKSTPEMTAYYDTERKALQDLVHDGHLQKREASNGTLYVIRLSDDLGDLPVAMSNSNLVIRSGDEILLKRQTASGRYVEAKMVVKDLEIEGNGEIEFRRDAGVDTSILRLQDAYANISADSRQRILTHNK